MGLSYFQQFLSHTIDYIIGLVGVYGKFVSLTPGPKSTKIILEIRQYILNVGYRSEYHSVISINIMILISQHYSQILYIKKGSGPNTDHWGTPQVISFLGGRIPFAKVLLIYLSNEF